MSGSDEPEFITQWKQITPQLIVAASDYAGAGEEDPRVSRNIREIKVLTAALMGALQALRV